MTPAGDATPGPASPPQFPVARAPARLRDRGVLAAYSVGWRALRSVPEPLATAAFRAVADLSFRRGGRGVRRLETNLARVTGEQLPAEQLRALTRAALRSYARYWLEVFRLPAIPLSRVVGQMRVQDEVRLRQAYAAGRGVILALPHMGNWDHAGAWAVATGMPFTTVAERVEPAGLFDRFVAFRQSLGMEVLALTGDDAPFRLLAARLRAGRMLCLLADRDLSAAGVPVQFCDAPARMPAGPALLALRTGAALLPVTLWYAEDGTGWRARIHPPVTVPALPEPQQVAAMTQAVADAFTAGVRAHPQDWHMLQRVWLDDVDLPSPPSRRSTAAVRRPLRVRR